MNASLRKLALWVVIVVLVLGLFTLFQDPDRRTSAPDISFSQFLKEVDQGRVRDVLVKGLVVYGTYTDGRVFQTYAPSEQSWMQWLSFKGVSFSFRPQHDVPWFVTLLVSWLPILVAVWVSLSRQQMRAWSDVANRPREEIDGLKRKIDELQTRLDQLSKDKPQVG